MLLLHCNATFNYFIILCNCRKVDCYIGKGYKFLCVPLYMFVFILGIADRADKIRIYRPLKRLNRVVWILKPSQLEWFWNGFYSKRIIHIQYVSMENWIGKFLTNFSFFLGSIKEILQNETTTRHKVIENVFKFSSFIFCISGFWFGFSKSFSYNFDFVL